MSPEQEASMIQKAAMEGLNRWRSNKSDSPCLLSCLVHLDQMKRQHRQSLVAAGLRQLEGVKLPGAL